VAGHPLGARTQLAPNAISLRASVGPAGDRRSEERTHFLFAMSDDGTSFQGGRASRHKKRRSAFVDRDEVPASDAGVDLFGSRDLLFLVLHEL
jgi:hypothetical protein